MWSNFPSPIPRRLLPFASTGPPVWRCVLASAREGEWSAPVQVRAQGRRGEGIYYFRLKVLSCSTAPLHLRLLNTPLHEVRGHSAPAGIWERHLGQVGPIEEQTD